MCTSSVRSTREHQAYTVRAHQVYIVRTCTSAEDVYAHSKRTKIACASIAHSVRVHIKCAECPCSHQTHRMCAHISSASSLRVCIKRVKSAHRASAHGVCVYSSSARSVRAHSHRTEYARALQAQDIRALQNQAHRAHMFIKHTKCACIKRTKGARAPHAREFCACAPSVHRARFTTSVQCMRVHIYHKARILSARSMRVYIMRVCFPSAQNSRRRPREARKVCACTCIAHSVRVCIKRTGCACTSSAQNVRVHIERMKCVAHEAHRVRVHHVHSAQDAYPSLVGTPCPLLCACQFTLVMLHTSPHGAGAIRFLTSQH